MGNNGSFKGTDTFVEGFEMGDRDRNVLAAWLWGF